MQLSFSGQSPKAIQPQYLHGSGRVSLPDINGNLNVVVNDANVTLGNTVGSLDIFVEDGFLQAGKVIGNAIVLWKSRRHQARRCERARRNLHRGIPCQVNKVNGLAYARLNNGRIQIGKADGGARLTIAEVGNIQIGDVTGEIQASTGEGKITVQRIGRINTDSSIFYQGWRDTNWRRH